MTKTPKTIEAIMQAGENTDFWRLICAEIDKNIVRLEQERDSDSIASMPANEYKLAMENIKDKINHLKTIKEMPQKIIQNLENPEEEEEDFDPYEKEK